MAITDPDTMKNWTFMIFFYFFNLTSLSVQKKEEKILDEIWL